MFLLWSDNFWPKSYKLTLSINPIFLSLLPFITGRHILLLLFDLPPSLLNWCCCHWFMLFILFMSCMLPLLCLELLLRNIESVSELLKSLSLEWVSYVGNRNFSLWLICMLGVFLWPATSLPSSRRKNWSSAIFVTEFLIASYRSCWDIMTSSSVMFDRSKTCPLAGAALNGLC